MLKKLKELIFKKNDSDITPPAPRSIDEYLKEVEILQVTPVEDEKTVIKVCSIEDERDAVDAIVLAEAGYIVIAKVPNLEKEIDDEFLEIIKKIRNEVLKIGGNLIILGDEHLLITPKNVVIEKLIREKKESQTPTKQKQQKEENKEESKQ